MSDVEVMDWSDDNQDTVDDKDPFDGFSSDEDVEIKEESEAAQVKQEAPELNQITGGGIFSESNVTSTISSEMGSTRGTSQFTGSVLGDPTYKAPSTPSVSLPSAPNLTAINNRTLKRKLYQKFLEEKRKVEKQKNSERREKRKNETPEEREAKKKAFGKTTAQVDYSQKTIENQRIWDETTVVAQPTPGQLPNIEAPVLDPEVGLEHANDEFASYFAGKVTPKVLITTGENARNRTWKLALEWGSCIPNSFVLKRKRLSVKKIIDQAKERNFTTVIVINDDRGVPNGALVSYLPDGPTALFKMTNVKLRCEICTKNPRGNKGKGPEHIQPTSHRPELIVKRFSTKLGHRVSRLFTSLYTHDPQFRGRQAATFYNMRDFIFFRFHRYQFKKDGQKAALLEMGPRFTLKLRWLQEGTFDSKTGTYEWIHKRHQQEKSRRKFHL